MTFILGLAVAVTAAAPSVAGECSGEEKLKAKCRERDGDRDVDVIHVRIKAGVPGANVTVRITGDDGYQQDFPVTLDDRGRGKLKVRVDGDDDDYTVSIVECDVNRRVECDD